jgi:1-aminocyclopropane-1-carboxylate deaminase/D-cysteine desulfhydrase-like pyridoxal-dependent ACC family enzyme
LIDGPTPVQRLAKLERMTGSPMLVKRDDIAGVPRNPNEPAYGANKVRKLELTLADARKHRATTLITAGAYGSHHVLATAVHGRRAGFGVHAFVFPQPIDDHVIENVRADLGQGAILHPLRFYAETPAALAALLLKLRRQGQRPYVIPHGGTSILGAIGCVAAGVELAAQITNREIEEPEAIYVALGSGGTAAGLAVGLAAAGLPTEIVAVRVSPRLFANDASVRLVARGLIRKLRELDPRFPPVDSLVAGSVTVDHGMYGDGYGTPSPESDRAKELAAADGLTLDTTYTSRALAAMLRDAEGRRHGRPLLFVNTLSSAPMEPLLVNAPALPSWASRRE